MTFALNNVAGWAQAPDLMATVVPAGLNPQSQGWFLDFYSDNVDPSIAEGDSYVLHYIDGKGKDHFADIAGNWANNPNCLDTKVFNHSTFMTLFVVSHFPHWGVGPKVILYDITDPTSPARLAETTPEWYQKGDAPASGASGDVCLCPSKDGFRMFLYYYDHMSQSLGAYVADCIKK